MPSQKQMADRIIAVARKTKVLSWDVEHDGNLRPYMPEFTLHGIGYAVKGFAAYIADRDQCMRIFSELDDPGIVWVTWYGGYDISCIRAAGWLPGKDAPGIQVDGALCLNLLEEERHENQIGLKPYVREYFGHRMTDYETAASYGLDSPEFHQYGREDVYWTLRLWLEDLKPRLEKEGLLKYAMKIPALGAFGDMQVAGMPWDVDWGIEQIRKVRKIRRALQKQMWDAFGPVNPNSAKQLEERFRQLGYNVDDASKFPRTDSGQLATSKEAIVQIAQVVPEAAPVSHFVTAGKILGTYLADLTLRSLREGGVTHPRFTLVSKTGRTRSSNFNAQNIPSTEIAFLDNLHVREGFRAPKGYTWVTCDLSQIELRLVAHVTRDKTLLAAYLNWECTACRSKGKSKTILHKCPKCGCTENEGILKDKSIEGFWHGLDLHQMTCDRIPALRGKRAIGKQANFAQVYGAGPYRMHMAQRDDAAKYGFPVEDILSPDEWRPIIDNWMRSYAGVKPWHRRVEKQIEKGEPIKDIFGRKRRLSLDGISEDDWGKRKHVLNQGWNFGPQSSAVGIAMIGIKKFREEMIDRGLWMNKVKLIAMVHDEYSLMVQNELSEKVSRRLQWHLEHAVHLRVPVRSDRQLGRSWAETH